MGRHDLGNEHLITGLILTSREDELQLTALCIIPVHDGHSVSSARAVQAGTPSPWASRTHPEQLGRQRGTLGVGAGGQSGARGEQSQAREAKHFWFPLCLRDFVR